MTQSAKQLASILGSGALALAFGLALYSSPVQAADPTCNEACVLYRSCVVEHGKRQSPPRNPTKKEFEVLYAGCMKTCRLHKAKVMMCYKQSKNSCAAYGVCIQRSYKK